MFVVVAMVAVVAVGTVRETSLWFCGECHVAQERSQWLFELSRFSRALSEPHVTAEHDSWIRREFYPQGHSHDWVYGVGTTRGLLQGSVGDGPLPPEIAVKYENDPAFRSWMHKQMEAGHVSRQRLVQMFALGKYQRDIHDAGPEGVLIDNERRAILEEYAVQR